MILGLEGEVRCRNYDIVDGSVNEESGEFRIRQTHDAWLLPGRFSSLSTARDNIHDLRAGAEGARVLDVFTDVGRSEGSRYMEVDEESPVDAERMILNARWRRR